MTKVTAIKSFMVQAPGLYLFQGQLLLNQEPTEPQDKATKWLTSYK
jgi:hypothetical protein